MPYIYVLFLFYLNLFFQLYFPVCHANHWFLFIVDLKNKRFVFMDSYFDEEDPFQCFVRDKLVSAFFLLHVFFVFLCILYILLIFILFHFFLMLCVFFLIRVFKVLWLLYSDSNIDVSSFKILYPAVPKQENT